VSNEFCIRNMSRTFTAIRMEERCINYTVLNDTVNSKVAATFITNGTTNEHAEYSASRLKVKMLRIPGFVKFSVQHPKLIICSII
jgi:hypothetical protein